MTDRTRARERAGAGRDTELLEALGDGRLEVRYRPVVDLVDGGVVGAEAVPTWRRGSDPPLTSGALSALAHGRGVVSDLTVRVVESVVQQARAWADAGRPLQCTVAVGAGCLADPGPSADVLSLVTSAPGLVGILTGGAVLRDAAATSTVLHMAGLDVGVTLDQFGGQDFSLAALRRLPATAVKLDRDLVADAVRGERDRTILQAVVRLAHALRVEVVADGVDDDRVATVMRDSGVGSALGHHYATALTAEELESWMDTWATAGLAARAAAPGDDGHGDARIGVDPVRPRELPAAVAGAGTGGQRTGGQGTGGQSTGGQSTASWTGGDPAPHLVMFYDDERELLDELTDFVRSGLVGAGHAIAVTTAQHRDALLAGLPPRAVARAELEGRLLLLDAEETLAGFRRGGTLVPELFDQSVGKLVRQHDRRGPVRVFNEMASVLWGEGDAAASMELETLWNDLLQRTAFTELCAYPLHDTDALQGEGLSSICNRHSSVHLSRRLESAGAGAGTADVIALLDLDRFREVNEKVGQEAGDRIVGSFTRVLREHLRPGDLAFRLTSVDFLVVLPGTTPEQALVVLEHVRLAWASQRALPVTFSAGIAASQDRDLETAMLSADSALYVAKTAGRDRFELAASVGTDAMEHLRASLA